MKNILLTSAAALMIAGPALAESHAAVSTEMDAQVGDTMSAEMDATAEAETGLGATIDEAQTSIADAANDAMDEIDAMTETDATVMATADSEEIIMIDGYTNVAVGELTAEMLIGQDVNNMEDEDLGTISDIVLTAEGDIDAVILDVGGFLGLGAKPVEIAYDDLQILEETDGDDMQVYMNANAEVLAEMPEYQAS
ncbi:hypothetical protein BVC71_09620 [Marivivens niveibacter]|uniref:PRC-barrel domain-containing protein n=1 Tax=Marivivens niveibacter TaxID=1930667 RepID=A0A251WYE2_9RHOB|nr:PRC-barrel domain-containing protein [Marivivens niveibacter]OUD08963.1 hypothetical protein BVC71_09620 [Marivivens niveibacter]